MTDTYEDYQRQVAQAMSANPNWRLGQALFNTLQEMHPSLASRVRLTNVDPFYLEGDCDELRAFYTYVFKNWGAA